MTAAATSPTTPTRNVPRSIGAVVSGIVVGAALSLGADQVLHWLGVFPPWGQITYEPLPFALATTYRCVFGVVGAWVTARLAPRAPMFHAMVLGALGLVVSIAGLAVALTRPIGPVWYSAALVITAIPCAWLGGKLYVLRAGSVASPPSSS